MCKIKIVLIIFLYRVNNFLNLLLCHEFVLSPTHLLAGWCLPIFFSSLLCLICGMYPLLVISCSISLEWYALSRHRFCFFFWFCFELNDDNGDGGLLITVLSTVSIATVTSWVLADVITVDSGIPSLSVRICLLLPNLLLSVGLWSVFAP